MSDHVYHDEKREHDHKECVISAMRIMNDPKCKGYVLVAKIEAEDGDDCVINICQFSRHDLMLSADALVRTAKEK